MLAYIITLALITPLLLSYFSDSKSLTSLKEDIGVKEESVFSLRFESSQVLGRWGTRISDIESHRDYYPNSDLAIKCEVKTKHNLIWSGDIDVNLHDDKLIELSKTIKKDIFIEVDGEVIYKVVNGHSKSKSNELLSTKRNNKIDEFFKKHK